MGSGANTDNVSASNSRERQLVRLLSYQVMGPDIARGIIIGIFIEPLVTVS